MNNFGMYDMNIPISMGTSFNSYSFPNGGKYMTTSMTTTSSMDTSMNSYYVPNGTMYMAEPSSVDTSRNSYYVPNDSVQRTIVADPVSEVI